MNTQNDWTPQEILKRGISLLTFMEKRWNIVLGDDAFKAKLLHLDKIPLSPLVDDKEVVA